MGFSEGGVNEGNGRTDILSMGIRSCERWFTYFFTYTKKKTWFKREKRLIIFMWVSGWGSYCIRRYYGWLTYFCNCIYTRISPADRLFGRGYSVIHEDPVREWARGWVCNEKRHAPIGIYSPVTIQSKPPHGITATIWIFRQTKFLSRTLWYYYMGDDLTFASYHNPHYIYMNIWVTRRRCIFIYLLVDVHVHVVNVQL